MTIIRLAPQWCRAAHEAAGGDLRHDVAQAVVGFGRSRRVVQGQQNSGDYLHQECKQRDAAEHLMPSGGGGNVFVKEVLDGALDAGTVFEPIEQSDETCRA